MYRYIHTYIYTYISMYVYIRIYIYSYVMYIYICIYMYMCKDIHYIYMFGCRQPTGQAKAGEGQASAVPGIHVGTGTALFPSRLAGAAAPRKPETFKPESLGATLSR